MSSSRDSNMTAVAGRIVLGAGADARFLGERFIRGFERNRWRRSM